eukprot:6208506-Pleurochrysis_carterae.AAC.1
MPRLCKRRHVQSKELLLHSALSVPKPLLCQAPSSKWLVERVEVKALARLQPSCRHAARAR